MCACLCASILSFYIQKLGSSVHYLAKWDSMRNTGTCYSTHKQVMCVGVCAILFAAMSLSLPEYIRKGAESGSWGGSQVVCKGALCTSLSVSMCFITISLTSYFLFIGSTGAAFPSN